MSDKRAMISLPRLSALMTYPRSNTRQPDHYASLRITDEDSGQVVAQIDLNPDQLFNLMANSMAYGEGLANTNAHRFGLHYDHMTVHLDRKEWGLEYNSDETHPAIRAHLTTLREVEGWEVVTYESKRGQHYIHCARWVDKT
jgi:hypothetical protein